MSSIDKYVEGEARKYNPNVCVSNSGGHIVGRINGRVVFDIADRYGYLSDSERSIIRESIHEYELERLEQERRERERLENERRAARDGLKRRVTEFKNQLTSAYGVAKRLGNEVVASTECEMKALEGYRTESYAKKAEKLRQDAQKCLASVDRDYREKLDRIESIASSIRENGSTAEFNALSGELARVNVNSVGGKFPVREIESFKAELKKLNAALGEVKVIERRLSSIRSGGLVNSIVSNALAEIRQHEITSLADVDEIVKRVQEHLSELSDIEYKNKTREDVNSIAEIAGALKSCTALRELTFESTYRRKNRDGEIAEIAARVYDEYSALAAAEYTTCSSEKLQSVFRTVSEVMIGTANGEEVLEVLKQLLEESAVYRRDDRLLKDDYDEYVKKIKELTEYGADVSEEAKFDAQNPQAQRKRLNAELLKADKRAAASTTATTFMMACQTMEEMGYEGLYCATSKNGLAFEAVYAKPGYDGVVWQIIASDCNIRRRLLGVKRADGRSTDVGTVLETAQEMDESGEVKKFLGSYAQKGGGRLRATGHVDTRDANSREAIIANGYFDLEKEGEAKYDAIVAKSAPKKRTSRSSYVTGATVVKVVSEDIEYESADCEARLMAKRR